MQPKDNQYGRARVKRAKQALSATNANSHDEAAERKKPTADHQTAMELPIKSEIIKSQSNEKVRDSGGNIPPSRQISKPKEPVKEKPFRNIGRREGGDPGRRPLQPKPNYPKKIKVSVIIPAYNEQDNLKPLMEQFDEVIRKFGSEWEVILVNDGSDDKTAERAKDLSNRYHWLRVTGYSKNRGITAALNEGFKHARGSIFVFYPADLQYHTAEIPKMLAKIDRGADVVTGWKQGKYNRRFVSFVYNRLCRFLFGVKVHDMNSIKAFKREVIEYIPLRRDLHRYLVVMAAESGFNLDEVKVELHPRYSGKSKFGASRILEGVLDLFSVKFQISFTKKPLRLFGSWGFFFGLAGAALGLAAIYERFFTTHGSRTLLYPSILFLFVGLILFAVGFLAEVIVSLRGGNRIAKI